MLLHTPPKHTADAIFIHGSSIRSDELDKALISHACSLVRRRVAPVVVVNGLSDKVCREKNLAYAGADSWRDMLHKRNVPVLQIPASPHTPAECDNLIKFASEQGWKRVEVLSLPHHLLRCAAQMVFCLKRAESPLEAFYSSFVFASWNMHAVKPVLGGGVEEGSFFDHIGIEHSRFEKYSDQSGSGYTPNASLGDLVEYLKKLYKVS